MSASILVVIGSGVALMLFVVLFRVESNRNGRVVLHGLRSFLDRGIMSAERRMSHFSLHFGGGAFRILLHYIAHWLLGCVLVVLNLFESQIAKLQNRNKAVAKSVRTAQKIQTLKPL